jgi:hypothetical protein
MFFSRNARTGFVASRAERSAALPTRSAPPYVITPKIPPRSHDPRLVNIPARNAITNAGGKRIDWTASWAMLVESTPCCVVTIVVTAIAASGTKKARVRRSRGS